MSVKTTKELRTLTGSGMIKCKEALNACNGSLGEAIAHLRSRGDEPGVEGVTEPRWDILNDDGSIKRTVYSKKELIPGEHLGCEVRYVNGVGEYFYTKGLVNLESELDWGSWLNKDCYVKQAVEELDFGFEIIKKIMKISELISYFSVCLGDVQAVYYNICVDDFSVSMKSKQKIDEAVVVSNIPNSSQDYKRFMACCETYCAEINLFILNFQHIEDEKAIINKHKKIEELN